MQIAGFVLAGGASRRMGRDKALLPAGSTDGGTMLQHIARIVGEASGGPATILGPASKYGHLALPVLEDAIPDCGPIGGLYTALRTTACERVLIAPVDMPNLTADFLRELIARTGRCTIAQGQPLCGVYHRDCLPVIEAAVRAGRLRMTDAAAALGAVEVAPTDPQILENRNTPEDWVRR